MEAPRSVFRVRWAPGVKVKFRESLGYLWAPGVKVKVRRKFEKAWWSTSLFFDKKSLDNNFVFFFSYDENVTG